MIQKNEKYKKTIDSIKSFFKNHQMSQIGVAFSGGKDSSALLVLVFEALLELKKENFELLLPLKIQFSNTMLELPDYEFYTRKVLLKIKEFSVKNELNIEIIELKPEIKNKFFNLVIGKGQPLPRRDMRWCTQRLKTVKNDKDTIMITGVRKEESTDRKKRLEDNDLGSNLKLIDNKITFTPIENFSLSDVWNIIRNNTQEWLDAKELEKLYLSASIDSSSEYPTARFGCWLCPLAGKEDKTLHKLAKKRKTYQLLEEVRNFIVSFQTKWMWGDMPVRDIYNHRNQVANPYVYNNPNKGTISPGGYSLNIRKMFLRRLVETFTEIRLIEPNFPVETYLSVEDIEYIQNIWFQEGDFDLTAFQIGRQLYSKIKYPNAFKLTKENANFKQLIACFLIYSDFDDVQELQKAVLEPEFNLDTLRVEILMLRHFCKTNKIDLNCDLDLLKLSKIEKKYLNQRGEIKKTLKEKGVFFGDNEIQKDYIYYEWKNQKAGFWEFLERLKNGEIKKPQQQNIFGGYNDIEYGEYFEILDEIQNMEDFLLESKKMPLEEKIRFIEGF